MKQLVFLLIALLFSIRLNAQNAYFRPPGNSLIRSEATDSAKSSAVKHDIRYDQSNYFVLGLVSLYQHYPSQFHLDPLEERGFMIGSSHNATNIDEIDFGNQLHISLNVGNQSFLGFASTSSYTKYPDNSVDTVHYYTGFVSLFSYNVNAEASVRLPITDDLDRRIIGGIAVTFLNLGGNFTYMSGGRFNDRFFGAFDAAPFCLQIYGKLALKNATFGVGFSSNPYSFAEYRFGPEGFVGGDSGLFLNSAQYTKYMMQFYIYFK